MKSLSSKEEKYQNLYLDMRRIGSLCSEFILNTVNIVGGPMRNAINLASLSGNLRMKEGKEFLEINMKSLLGCIFFAVQR
jgi:hypothetical protein